MRFITRIVESIGEITTENNILAQVFLLSDAKRTSQHTHVGMNSHQHDILTLFLLKEIEYFLAIIAHPVITNNLDCRMLMSVMISQGLGIGVIATPSRWMSLA